MNMDVDRDIESWGFFVILDEDCIEHSNSNSKSNPKKKVTQELETILEDDDKKDDNNDINNDKKNKNIFDLFCCYTCRITFTIVFAFTVFYFVD